MSANTNAKLDAGRAYHTQCTGEALITVKAHEQEEDMTLFGGCFCPFVQRVWVVFEVLGIPYKAWSDMIHQFITNSCWCFSLLFCSTTIDEVDPYNKSKELLEVSPKGLIPGIRFNRFNPPRSLNESTIIMDFLEDLAATTTKKSILPPITNPYARGLVRLQADFVNRTLIPAFYRYLQAQTEDKQIEGGKDFHAALEGLVSLLERAEREILGSGGAAGVGEVSELRKGLGVWVPGEENLGWADIMAGPWLYRAKVVLTHYRGFEMPKGELFNGWLVRLFEHPAFKATCSTEQLYLDSYERYAFNRPNTSMVATAINEGKALP